ncbi:DUF3040 domain-containing protein [Rothia sp. AR01]|uniref:DUF3040 domain-containing protein n=1 Tax=Rothia santali TaxID=2949643 RepID=A0A9X2KI28_9MICC|nr:DUF3040 domain-containing protein [Rothia santali]MCP3426472.1 DUF3040 domain-containing protein [Rothia santali]
MPLSEREQKLLEQLEQQLNHEDPKFAESMHGETRGSGTVRMPSVRHIVLGVVVAVIGLAAVIAGVATKLIIIGVVGFVIMGAGVYLATLGKKREAGASGRADRGASSGQSSFMSRLEHQWDKRQERP